MSNYNELVAAKFGMSHIDEYIASNGEKGAPETKGKVKLKQTDMIKPITDVDGSLAGF